MPARNACVLATASAADQHSSLRYISIEEQLQLLLAVAHAVAPTSHQHSSLRYISALLYMLVYNIYIHTYLSIYLSIYMYICIFTDTYQPEIESQPIFFARCRGSARIPSVFILSY